MRITPKEVLFFETWFEDYTGNFKQLNPSLPNGYALKSNHTQNVCIEMNALGKSLMLDSYQLRIAHIIALFHDIGRFEQFRKYNSFADKKTENHALLGVKVLKKYKVLDNLQPEAKSIIIKAIQLHNVKNPPKIKDKTLALFVNLIRDADKLDIFSLASHHYQNSKESNSAIELELPNTDDFSEDICQQLINGINVDFVLMKSLNDFKLRQLGWVFDIIFNYSLLKILNCGYIDGIASTLPNKPSIHKVIHHVHHYIAERLNLQN